MRRFIVLALPIDDRTTYLCQFFPPSRDLKMPAGLYLPVPKYMCFGCSGSTATEQTDIVSSLSVNGTQFFPPLVDFQRPGPFCVCPIPPAYIVLESVGWKAKQVILPVQSSGLIKRGPIKCRRLH